METKELRMRIKKKAAVAMSGGVDSSVAAAILQKRGFEVIGIFLKFWRDPKVKTEVENLCCSIEALTCARAVARKLRIPFYVLDFSKPFKKMVVDYYLKEYQSGRTPNPCVMCNKWIKFDLLLKKAFALGADYLATGHYARLWRTKLKSKNEKGKTTTKNLKLLSAKDQIKDQSYFLWTLTQEQLKHLLFPIGDYTKKQVRKMAQKWQLPTAQRADSQGICFIPDRNNPSFLARYLKKLKKEGPILDLKGKVLGKHCGLGFYTIGQRHGLGIFDTLPLYVLKLDVSKNALIVGREEDLYKDGLLANGTNWIEPKAKKNINKGDAINCQAKIRYGHKATGCRLSKLKSKNEKLKIVFQKPVRAITPGQSIVFYSADEVLGGGVIH